MHKCENNCKIYGPAAFIFFKVPELFDDVLKI